MPDRRTFLATLGAGVGAVAASCVPLWRGTSLAVASAVPERLGLQLYTVRSLLAAEFDATLERVAAIGYREVEFAGYHGRPAATVRAVLDRSGLAAPSAHVAVDATGDDWARLVDAAAVVGHRWLTLPWVAARGWERADWQRLAALLNERGAAAARAGLRVAYHNHDFELRGGDPVPLELLLRDTDPELVDFELDVYWLVRAGGDPLRWIARHPGRIRMLHLKDTEGAPGHRMVDVGAGSIDWGAVIRGAIQGGAQHLFVEHDAPADPLESAAASYAHLAGLRARTAP